MKGDEDLLEGIRREFSGLCGGAVELRIEEERGFSVYAFVGDVRKGFAGEFDTKGQAEAFAALLASLPEAG